MLCNRLCRFFASYNIPDAPRLPPPTPLFFEEGGFGGRSPRVLHDGSPDVISVCWETGPHVWGIGKAFSRSVWPVFSFIIGCRHFSPSRNKMLSGFLQAMLAPFGVKVWLSYDPVGAILGPCSAILGPTSAILVLKAIWNHFRPCYFGIYTQKQPQTIPPKRSPKWPSRLKRINAKKPIKNQNLLQNANLHDSTGKTSPNIHPKSTSRTLSPVALETQKNKCKKPIKNQNLLQNPNLHDSTGKTSPNIHPKSTSRTLSPVALETQKNKCKKPIKNQNLLQNPNLHDSTGKTSPNIHPKSTSRTLSPVALQLQPLSRQPKKGPP